MSIDLIYIALFVVVFPLWDYLVYWPKLERDLKSDPVAARKRLWTSAIVWPWLLVGVVAVQWIVQERNWIELGFLLPAGWRLWTACVVLLLIATYYTLAIATVARNAETRAGIRANTSMMLLMPHTSSDMWRWTGVSITAGFCEEVLYRGFVIWVFAPVLTWWGAAALSVVLFAAGHAYQGWKGAVNTGIVAVIYTLLVALFDSLWPAIVLHAMVDLASGLMAWLALRDQPTSQDPLISKPT